MARKATDLLDVFRYAGDGDDGDGRVVSSDRGRKGSKKKKARKAKSKGADKGFDGVILTRRQVILGASVCCLLVALSFVLGLSAGRPGSEDTPAASRTAANGRVVIQGEMPAIHLSTQRPIDVDAVRSELVRVYGVPSGNLRISSRDGRILLQIGLFGSKEEAQAFLTSHGLDMAHIFGADPFAPARFVTAP